VRCVRAGPVRAGPIVSGPSSSHSATPWPSRLPSWPPWSRCYAYSSQTPCWARPAGELRRRDCKGFYMILSALHATSCPGPALLLQVCRLLGRYTWLMKPRNEQACDAVNGSSACLAQMAVSLRSSAQMAVLPRSSRGYLPVLSRPSRVDDCRITCLLVCWAYVRWRCVSRSEMQRGRRRRMSSTTACGALKTRAAYGTVASSVSFIRAIALR
jgi:hypothetical protein